MRRPQLSGWCGNPSETDGISSHERCTGGNRANPSKEFQPCPCQCHLDVERYECENCTYELAEAPMWPNEDEPGEPVYVHVTRDGLRALGEECPR